MDVNNFWDLTFSHIKIKTVMLTRYLGKIQELSSTWKHNYTLFTNPTQFQNAAFKNSVRSSLPGAICNYEENVNYSQFSESKIEPKAVVTFDCGIHKKFLSF